MLNLQETKHLLQSLGFLPSRKPEATSERERKREAVRCSLRKTMAPFACLKVWLIRLVFSAETVFFSPNNLAGNSVFQPVSAKVQTSEWGHSSSHSIFILVNNALKSRKS